MTIAEQLSREPLVARTRAFAAGLAPHVDCPDTCPWVQAVARVVWDDLALPAYDLDVCTAKVAP
jgi:hypothetical protein